MAKVYLNMAELMHKTGASDATLYDHVKRGTLAAPVRRKGTNAVGKRMIMNHWHKDEVQRFLDSGVLKLKTKRKTDHAAVEESLEQLVTEASRDNGFWYVGCFIAGTLFGLVLPLLEGLL